MRKAGCGNATLAMRIAAVEPEYLWFGAGNFDAGPTDGLEPNAVYSASGILRDMPVLQAMRNGQADVIDFHLVGGSSLPQTWINDPEGAGIIGARVNLGLIGFDRDLQPIGDTAWFWPGRVGNLSSSGGPEGKVIALSVYNGRVLRSRAQLRRWSNASHQSRHPGDQGCERTDLYRVLTTVTWPK